MLPCLPSPPCFRLPQFPFYSSRSSPLRIPLVERSAASPVTPSTPIPLLTQTTIALINSTVDHNIASLVTSHPTVKHAKRQRADPSSGRGVYDRRMCRQRLFARFVSTLNQPFRSSNNNSILKSSSPKQRYSQATKTTSEGSTNSGMCVVIFTRQLLKLKGECGM